MNQIFKFVVYLVGAAAISLTSHASSFDDFFRAVRSDDAGTISDLLKRGFDPNTRDARGQTGLILAVREPSPRVVKVLLNAPTLDPEARNASDESPLMMAALKGDAEVVKRLVALDAHVNKPGWTALHYAATNGHVDIMRLLLENHAFIDAQSPNGTTPLMMAAMYGSTQAVQLLLDEGADTGMRNEQGMTALDFAHRGQRPDAVELLSKAGRATRRSGGSW